MYVRMLKNKIKQLARDVGYVDCGIASLDPFVEFSAAIETRCREFPELAEEYGKMRQRAFPDRYNPWARSLVVCIHWYGKYKIPEAVSKGIGRSYLCDRRNKACPDHEIPERMKRGMQQLGLRVRRGGVPDRWAAARAGVARFGRNNFAYSGQYGSWINIEPFLVDAPLPFDEPTYDLACPEACRRCIDQCPSKAFQRALCMRFDRCIAYLSYKAPEPIEPELWRHMGPWIYGCDQCQLVCPLNAGTWRGHETADWLERMAPYLTDEALAEMEDTTFRDVVQPAFWYIPGDGVERWRRNARRALAHDRERNQKAVPCRKGKSDA